MKKRRDPWGENRATENQYARDLRSIARVIGRLVNSFKVTKLEDFPALKQALDKYAELLRPWAALRAESMLEQVNHMNRRRWATATEEMSFSMRQTIKNTPVGERFRELMNEQVKLITSLPRKASERVHELVIKNVEQQGRAKDIAREIARSGKVTESRATLIARTEVSRASSVLTQARAESVGSEGYIWRTAHDADVRPSHKKMEGKYVAWDSPPTLDGLTGHAGALPNCRCFAEPVIPKELL